jgi:hypothetical protein
MSEDISCDTPDTWRKQRYLLQQSAAFNGFFTFGLNNLMPANELGAVLLVKPHHSFLLDSLVHRAIGRRGHPFETSVWRQSACPTLKCRRDGKQSVGLAESRIVKSLSVDLYYVG